MGSGRLGFGRLGWAGLDLAGIGEKVVGWLGTEMGVPEFCFYTWIRYLYSRLHCTVPFDLSLFGLTSLLVGK